MYGVLITFEKFTGVPQRLTNSTAIGLYRLFTVAVVMFGFVLFGSADIGAALYQIRVMLRFTKTPLYDMKGLFFLKEYLPFYVLGIFAATPGWRLLIAKMPRKPVTQVIKTVGYMLIVLLSISYIAMGAHNPFIYFNF